MKLTEHFTLEELTHTSVRGVDNTPTTLIIDNLTYTANMMERIRSLLLNSPIIVTSGYRSIEVNKAIGGTPWSQHTRGQAVDFICPSYGTPFVIAKYLESNMDFLTIDQLIYEGTWVHCSFKPFNYRKDCLTARFENGRTNYKMGIVE